MRCEDANCVHDHVFPRLTDPKPTESGGYRALAPCHEDTQHSLSISIGQNGRPIWNCFACRHRIGKDLMLARTRSALIEAGVPARCLPVPAGQAREFEAEVRGVIFGGGSRAHGWLLIAAKLEGYDELPHGDELAELAARCGVSRREAFKARAALQPLTRTGPDDHEVVKPRRSEP